jgi:NADH dehydrogenase [ubiquinone] 1 alpha subcomplex assembly factor 7
MNLKSQLIEDIRTRGPMPVAEYMRRCVAHYYATRDPFGTKGDFTTAPEISQIFGELIGAWLADCWERLGAPQFTLCELGPGRGTLMNDILHATRATGFHEAAQLLLTENSPKLRAQQEKVLKGAHPRISWQDHIDSFPPLPLLLVANEFFDALPVHQYIRTSAGEAERAVTVGMTGLTWHPAAGTVTRENTPDAASVMARIAGHIRTHGGAALIIDYGYHGGIQADTLQALRSHRKVSPLDEPGETDLTAHVDFTALKNAAAAQGSLTFGPVEQGVFLTRLGAQMRAQALCKSVPESREAILAGLERLTSPSQMGSLFKVMAVTSELDKPAGF